jgi:hypothetical protein
MSRSAHSRQSKLKELPSHKRLRKAVHQALSHELVRVTSVRRGAWVEVLADELEENGQLDKADALRNELELVLPTAPHGWNTRLRW